MDEELIDQIMWERCLPEDSRDVVAEIFKIEDIDEFQDELDVFTGNCYRSDPNHPRYDRNRRAFPRTPIAE